MSLCTRTIAVCRSAAAMPVTLHSAVSAGVALICRASAAAALFGVCRSCCGKVALPGPQMWLPIR